jgi:hypothetical protein
MGYSLSELPHYAAQEVHHTQKQQRVYAEIPAM